MDSWYAQRKRMLPIECLNKVYYCPLKDNRQGDETGRERGYQRLDSLMWTELEQQQGKVVHLKTFPRGASGEIVPVGAFLQAHGLCCYQ
jgi:hypothetical protein